MRVDETGPLNIAEASGLPRDANFRRPIVVVWPRTSKLTACGCCKEQLRANDYAARMRLFAESAERFWERELGVPYRPFTGRSA